MYPGALHCASMGEGVKDFPWHWLLGCTTSMQTAFGRNDQLVTNYTNFNELTTKIRVHSSKFVQFVTEVLPGIP